MKPLVLVLMVGSLLVGGPWDAQAQTRGRGKPAKAQTDTSKHYRWEDANGQTHFSDTLPVEALRQGRTVYQGGQPVARIERLPTAEEQAELDRAAQALAAQQALAQEQERARALLGQSYPDPGAVRADFAQRKVFLDDRITASQATIAQHRRVLLEQLRRAAELELQEKKVPAKLAKSIQEAASVVRENQANIERTHGEIARLNDEEAAILKTLGWSTTPP